jgi:hypothetical protein
MKNNLFKIKWNKLIRGLIHAKGLMDDHPMLNKEMVNGVEIWSIFKRTSGNENPLLYALEGEKGRKFKANKDDNAIFSQVEKIVEKFVAMHNYDITIVLPSRSKINDYLVSVLKNKAKSAIVIDDILMKSTVEDVDSIVTMPNSPFFQKYGKDRRTFEEALGRFRDYCAKMTDVFFRYSLIPDIEMREVIQNAISLDNAKVGRYAESINDKNMTIPICTVKH